MAPRKKKKTNEVSSLQTVSGWPDTVPILTAEDMVWSFVTVDGRRDLSEWLLATFNPDYPVIDTPEHAEAFNTLCAVLSSRSGVTVSSLWTFLEKACKTKSPKLAWQAACWNEMLHRLGYDISKSAVKDPGIT